MADIELLSRHMAVDTIISGDVSAGVYMFATWLNIQTFERFAALLLRASGPDALTEFSIDVADDAAGAVNLTGGPPLTNVANIANEQETALIECTASDLYGYSATARYCNIFLNAAGGTPFVATMIRYNPRYARATLTTVDETAWT